MLQGPELEHGLMSPSSGDGGAVAAKLQGEGGFLCAL